MHLQYKQVEEEEDGLQDATHDVGKRSHHGAGILQGHCKVAALPVCHVSGESGAGNIIIRIVSGTFLNNHRYVCISYD